MKLQSLIHWQICQSLPHYTHINSIVKSTSNANPTNKIRTEMPNSNSKQKGIFICTHQVKTSPREVRATEWTPPRATERTESKWGFKVGTKSGFSWPNPRRPPSPFPQIQSLPLTSNDEWNSPQERPTSPNGFVEETRRPGVGERANEDWETMRLATGVGYRRISSMPPPSWPEAPLPHERSWRVTVSVWSSCSGLYKRGTLVEEGLEERWRVRMKVLLLLWQWRSTRDIILADASLWASHWLHFSLQGFTLFQVIIIYKQLSLISISISSSQWNEFFFFFWSETKIRNEWVNYKRIELNK